MTHGVEPGLPCDDANTVTVGGAVRRVGLGAAVGAVLGTGAAFVWMQLTEAERDPLFGGPALDLFLAVCVGGFVGTFLGAAGGWLWLIAACDPVHESRGRKPPDQSQAQPSCDHDNREIPWKK